MEQKKNSTPLRTALIYSVFGFLWILVSDILVEINGPAATYSHITTQTLKGWLFVFGSASLIYFILRRELKALRESEERYRDLVENSQSLICTHDLEGRLLSVNEAAVVLSGYSREALLQMNLQSMLAPNDGEQFKAYIQEIKTKGQAKGLMKIRLADGSFRVWAYNNTLRADGRKAPIVRGSARDITERKQAEDALRESEERYHMLYDFSLDAILLTVPNGDVLSANPAACRMFGKTEEEIRQDGRTGLVDTSDPRLISALEERARTGRFNGELTFLRKDGSKFPGEVSAALFKSSDGQVRSSMVIRDITERRQAEDALQKNELRFRALIEHGLDNISLLAADGTLLWENPASTQMLGYAYDQFKGRNIFELLHPDDMESVQMQFAELLGEPGRVAHSAFRLKHSDGSWRWAEGVGTNLLHEPSVGAVVINYRDVTNRKEAEELLQKSEQNYRDLLEQASDGIFIANPQGYYILVNQAACDLTGYSREELLSMHLRELVAPEDLQKQPLRLEELRAGKTLIVERTFLHKNGTRFQCELSAKMLPDGRFQSLVRNITERKQAEEKLQESEETYRYLFANHPHPMWIYDLKTLAFLEVNDAAIAKYGYSHTEFLQMGIEDIRPAEELPLLMKNLEQARQIMEYSEGWHHCLKNGNVIDVSITSHTIQFGGRESALVVAQDITERKQAERKLKLQSAMLEASANAIVITNSHGLIEWANPAFTRLTGYHVPDEVFGHNPRELVRSGKQNQAFYKDLWDTILAGRAWHGELINRRKDGSLYDEEMTITPVKNDAGETANFIAIKQDITERKQVEEKLRESQLKLQSIIDYSPALISIKDLSGNVILANKSFAALDAPPLNEFIGKNIFDLFPKEVAQHLWDNDLAALRNNAPIRSEEVVKHKDGSWHTYWTVKFPLYLDSGRTFGVCAISDDITERKKAEELIQQYAHELENRVAERTMELIHANHAKDEFLANMSHELRTPLTGILGIAEVLLAEYQGPLTEKQARNVEMISSSGQHLLGLINDILDVSKIEAGKFELKPETISINDVCLASLVFVKQMAVKKSITVEFTPSSNRESIFADPKRLKQILVNLITNAVKFTPENGTVCLKVWEGAHEIFFSITDNGIGISTENLKKLFHPFVQLDSSLSRQYEGTGLGLILVKRLVELHGGEVVVESEVGRGSCFQFSIPLQPDTKLEESPLPAALPKAGAKAPVPQGLGRHILIAEDNPVNMMVMSDFLSENGYILIQARNGIEAINQTLKEKPDLILMDIQMPDVNGLDAIKQIRANPETESTPIIALTALAMPGDRENCLSAGANEYITKPLSLRNLAETMARFLKLDKIN